MSGEKAKKVAKGTFIRREEKEGSRVQEKSMHLPNRVLKNNLRMTVYS